MLRRLLLCCFLLCAPLLTFALTPQQAKAIADGDSDDRIAALNKVVADGEPGIADFLQALLDDAVKVAGDKVYIVHGDKAVDASTGQPATVPAEAEDVMNNNR